MSKKRSIKSFKRKIYLKEPNKYFLIICEGAKTEPNYFKSFRVNKEIVSIEIDGLGANTDSLVEYAIVEKKKIETEREIKFDQVWCVFDRDSFDPQKFNRAVQLAENKNFQVAYSNEAFELWYLLHFEYLNTGITRVQYREKLTKLLGHRYEKNSKMIYDELKDKQWVAIQNATNLLSQYNPLNPEKDKPSTKVHLLVEELNKYLI